MRLIDGLMVVMALSAGTMQVAATAFSQTKDDLMQYQVELQEVKAQPALVIKGKASMDAVGELIGKNLGRIEAYLRSKNTAPAGAPFTRTFSFDKGMLEFETGFPLATKLAGHADIQGTELPKGLVATTVHVGSQETSQAAYEAIQAWMAAHGKREAGAPWEAYLTDPATTPPDQAKMQVYFPVK